MPLIMMFDELTQIQFITHKVDSIYCNFRKLIITTLLKNY